MGKKRWTTPEQQAWLEGHVAAFVQAQQEKTTGTFFKDTYSQWYKRWPTAAPTEDEIEDVEGNIEKACTCKHKAIDNVSVY
jgi:hypothetical protein